MHENTSDPFPVVKLNPSLHFTSQRLWRFDPRPADTHNV